MIFDLFAAQSDGTHFFLPNGTTALPKLNQDAKQQRTLEKSHLL